jgi:hypothetical protein
MSSATEPTVSRLESQPAALQAELFQPRPDEIPIGPAPFHQTVRGIPLSISVSGFLSFLPVGSQLQVNARAFVDLSDLQRKIGSLIDTIPLPTDTCAHFSADNVVARIWGKEITVGGDVATLTLYGDVDDWICFEVPFSSPFNERVGNQPFDATLPFRVEVADPHAIAVRLGNPSVNLGGQFGGVTAGILRIASVDINGLVKEALDHLITPDLLKQTLPADLLQLDPAITRAELLSNSGALAMYVEMRATLDGRALGLLIQALWGGG